MTPSLPFNTKHAMAKQDPQNEDVFPIFFLALVQQPGCVSAATCVCDNTCQSLWCHSLKDRGEFCWQSAKKANSQRKLPTCSSVFPSTAPYLFWCLLVALKLITDEYLPGYIYFLMGLVLHDGFILMAIAVFPPAWFAVNLTNPSSNTFQLTRIQRARIFLSNWGFSPLWRFLL